MLSRFELSKELIETVIEENEFYELKVSCPSCQSIDDEQYTCTDCWGQGGNTEYKVNVILKAAFDLKYNKDEKNEFTLEEIKELVNESISSHCIWLFLDDENYKYLIKKSEDQEWQNYRVLDIENVFYYLLNMD